MKYILVLAILFSMSAIGFDPTENLYFYKAEVKSVYDGDTLRADLDLGLGIFVHNESIRLNGLNAPEVRGADKARGFESRDYLIKLVSNHTVVVETIKDDREKYGRLLGNIWVLGTGDWCPSGTWCSVNEQMIKANKAIRKVY